MIKKIVKVQNVGKFHSCQARGDVEFNNMTLIYAENGRGKTTICDILHSLKTGDPAYISGRHSLGCEDDSEVHIRLNSDSALFQNGAWSKNFPNIHIFDTNFVYENVYAGDYVDHEHKKNLYRVIVGEEGVKLTNEVDNLDKQIRNLNKEIYSKRIAAEKHVPKGMTLEQFLSIPKENKIEQKIKDAETTVTSLESADEINNKKILEKITLPTLPDNFQSLLSKQLDDVSQDAESLLKNHIDKHTEHATEAWISEGINYVKENTCPFCAQEITNNKLIDVYQEYFSKSYTALKIEVSSLFDLIGTQFGEAALLKIQKTINENQTLSLFWKQFLKIEEPIISFDKDIRDVLNALRTIAQMYAKQKISTPLESVIPDQNFKTAFQNYLTVTTKVKKYNLTVDQSNKLMNQKKVETEAGDLGQANRTLEHFKTIKQRHEPGPDHTCQEYFSALEYKEKLEKQKQEAKNKLDRYTEKILPEYEQSINKLLIMFNAGFQIGSTARKYIGGTASASFEILIDGVSVPLGDADSPLETACFKNTLSAGDRSTLALAFFIAQLQLDQSLSEKVLVFDDPFTSQDKSRRTCTQQLLCQLSRNSRQVIVLSHDPNFLRLIWDNVSNSIRKAIQLSRMGRSTIITEWDIEDATRDEYAKNHLVLSDYYYHGNGDPRLVAKIIRPHLEHYLRIKFPRSFLSNEWLGDFIKKIHEADITNPLFGAQTIMSELEDINEYAKKYHHSTNQGADTEHIDDTELAGFVRRTLNLVGGF